MRTSSSLLLFSVFLLSLVTAASSYPFTSCNVTQDKIPLPAGQTNLTTPSDANPKYVTVGFGTQNYTCSTAGKYTSIGAVAELFDASCLYDTLHAAHNKTHSSVEEIQASMHATLGSDPPVLGRHYFVSNPAPGGMGSSPAFDFRGDSRKGDPDAYVIASKIGDLPSPNSPSKDVDWLELKAINGSLATYVFRILTVGGQPPSWCIPGSPPITVPYYANYWFFK